MDNSEFDRALIAAVFDRAAALGWRRVRVADAARSAGLDLARARARFPCRGVVLWRFGRLADEAALAAAGEGAVKDRLFEMLMRRLDLLQAHRPGMLALMRHLPTDPLLALMLANATEDSMRWILEGAGVSGSGPLGRLRAKALTTVWLWALRAWSRDESPDLAATMAALDRALERAGALARRFGPGPPPAEPPAGPPSGPLPEPPAGPLQEPPAEPPAQS